ncbi:MAG: glycoside hydrolase family 25 protein [Oscillospiraceae bacterium]|nr:glycoside hydrolase family 25 protein [Oscillospiraceae bacterium]
MKKGLYENMKRILKKTIVLICLTALILTYLPLISSASSAEAEWNGRTPLQSGTAYIINEQVSLSSDLIIPDGVILTVNDGGKLMLTSGMKLTIRGNLIVRGSLEIRRANVDVRRGGALWVLGSVLQYPDTTVNVIDGRVDIRAGGELTSSGNISIFSLGTFSNAGEITTTGRSVITATGAIENTVSGSIIIHGAVTITPSGSVLSFGVFWVARNGDVVNHGTFKLGGDSRIVGTGSFRTALRGLFIDNDEDIAEPPEVRLPHPFEKMTAMILENEPRVELRGIDVSFWQGDIDWARVADSGRVDFVMLRAARGHINSDRPMIEDTRFREYIEGALANGLDVGVYFYSYARSVEDARREAEFLIEVIRGYELTYPVVFDIEDPIHERMSMELITAMTEAFFEVLMNNGYFPMLYSYKYFLETKIDPRVLDTYAVWLAQWASRPTYERPFHIWQYTDKGRIPGINGDVDLNISYINFPEVLRRHGLNNLR